MGIIIELLKHGVLAQLARAPACHVGGLEFESRTSCHSKYEVRSFRSRPHTFFRLSNHALGSISGVMFQKVCPLGFLLNSL